MRLVPGQDSATDDVIFSTPGPAQVPDRRPARLRHDDRGGPRAGHRHPCRRAEAGSDLRVLPARSRARTSSAPTARRARSRTSSGRNRRRHLTDKACKPVNVMGMTKALWSACYRRQPRGRSHPLRVRALRQRDRVPRLGRSRFPRPDRPRRPGDDHDARDDAFPAVLDQAVDTVFEALDNARPGEIYVPPCPRRASWTSRMR